MTGDRVPFLFGYSYLISLKLFFYLSICFLDIYLCIGFEVDETLKKEHLYDVIRQNKQLLSGFYAMYCAQPSSYCLQS